jgi:hypothetical protein
MSFSCSALCLLRQLGVARSVDGELDCHVTQAPNSWVSDRFAWRNEPCRARRLPRGLLPPIIPRIQGHDMAILSFIEGLWPRKTCERHIVED